MSRARLESESSGSTALIAETLSAGLIGRSGENGFMSGAASAGSKKIECRLPCTDHLREGYARAVVTTFNQLIAQKDKLGYDVERIYKKKTTD